MILDFVFYHPKVEQTCPDSVGTESFSVPWSTQTTRCRRLYSLPGYQSPLCEWQVSRTSDHKRGPDESPPPLVSQFSPLSLYIWQLVLMNHVGVDTLVNDEAGEQLVSCTSNVMTPFFSSRDCPFLPRVSLAFQWNHHYLLCISISSHTSRPNDDPPSEDLKHHSERRTFAPQSSPLPPPSILDMRQIVIWLRCRDDGIPEAQ
mmetsp:Transcript_18514/g.33510  ORF Transcript_18514/g.33510 Transcript_18514/m.33510 type:complete len:203 (-) Transcript_18514:606-1214(-)